MQSQPRLIDFIPSRHLWTALSSIGGLTAIGSLLTVYAYLPQIAAAGQITRLEAIDLAGRGNLSTWFSSVLLLTGSIVSAMIYSLRRHRVDDYKGRYRIWLIAAIALLAMSIDETAGVRFTLQDVASHLSRTNLFKDGTLWWVASWILVISAVGIRLLLDTKQCRSSTAVLALAGLLWIGSAVVQLGITVGDERQATMMLVGCRMTSYLFVLLGLILHARYVISDIQGLNTTTGSQDKPSRAKSAKHTQLADSSPSVVKLEGTRKNSKASERRTDLDPPSLPIAGPEKPSAAKKVPPQPTPAEPEAEFDDDALLEPSGGHRKLSRGERKRLRQEKEQHRKAG